MFDGNLSLSELTEAFWSNYQSAVGDRPGRLAAEARSWSTELVSGLVTRGGPLAIELIVALCESAPDDDALAYLGASVIEDLFGQGGVEHPDNGERLELLEQRIRRNPAVRAAYNGSWDEGLPFEVAERLRKYRSAR